MKVKRNIKKIFFDFETTYANPLKANLFQATFVFTDGNNEIIDELNEYIKINERYEDFNEEEKQTLLDIHKVRNQTDLDEHNKKGISNEELLDLFEEKITNFFGVDNFKYCELYGWNCNTFDNIIFQIKFNEIVKRVNFKYRIVDLKDRYFLLKNTIGYINNERLDKFILKNGDSVRAKNSLEVVYRFLIEDKDLDFHNSETDVLVLLELDRKFNEIFESFRE